MQFAFYADDPESGIDSVTAYLDGSYAVADGDALYLSDLGEHTFTVTATNGVRLTTEETVIFSVDHFAWLPPVKYLGGSTTETRPTYLELNSTVPIKFVRFDSTGSFVEDPSVQVFVLGTTAAFDYGEGGDANVRVSMPKKGDPTYVANLHTNFRHSDYGFEEDGEYWVEVLFDGISAGKTKLIVR